MARGKDDLYMAFALLRQIGRNTVQHNDFGVDDLDEQ